MSTLFGPLGVLRSFSWKGFFVFLAFTAGLTAWTWSGVFFSPKALDWKEESAYFLSIFQRGLLNYFPMYLFVAIADGLPLKGAKRRWALGAALVAGAAFAVQLRCAVNPWQMFYAYENKMLRYCTTFPTWRTYLDFPAAFLWPLTLGGMSMIFIFARRRDGELMARLREARAAQLESRRQRIESEMEAMHARVDPERLLATLRDVRARYESNLEEGEAKLEDLIADLRRAAHHPSAEPPPLPA